MGEQPRSGTHAFIFPSASALPIRVTERELFSTNRLFTLSGLFAWTPACHEKVPVNFYCLCPDDPPSAPASLYKLDNLAKPIMGSCKKTNQILQVWEVDQIVFCWKIAPRLLRLLRVNWITDDSSSSKYSKNSEENSGGEERVWDKKLIVNCGSTEHNI